MSSEKEALHRLKKYGYPYREQEQRASGRFKKLCGQPGLNTIINGYPIHFEVKGTSRFELYDAINKAEHDAQNAWPVVMHRQGRNPLVVTLTLDNFMSILMASEADKKQMLEYENRDYWIEETPFL